MYGICLDHKGPNERKGKPVSAFLADMAANAGPNAVGNVPAGEVCTFTLTISKGHSAMSAKNSAEAEPIVENQS